MKQAEMYFHVDHLPICGHGWMLTARSEHTVFFHGLTTRYIGRINGTDCPQCLDLARRRFRRKARKMEKMLNGPTAVGKLME